MPVFVFWGEDSSNIDFMSVTFRGLFWHYYTLFCLFPSPTPPVVIQVFCNVVFEFLFHFVCLFCFFFVFFCFVFFVFLYKNHSPRATA